VKFSLVIPCYNESKNLPLLVERCKTIIENSEIEVIIVDNGSTDESPEIISSLLLEYPDLKALRVKLNQGYGFGILTGLKAATGDVLGWTHADMQTDPQDVLRGVEFFKTHGTDCFVKGRRYGRPLTDVIFTIGMSFFETILLAKPLWDINAQPTMFSRTFFEAWQEPPHDFSLDLYAYYKARLIGLKVYRFPVNFGKRAHGASHWNISWAEKRKFIHRTLQFSMNLRKSHKK
jgi:glycosyltransferase involved in cell wall biosynthesis